MNISYERILNFCSNLEVSISFGFSLKSIHVSAYSVSAIYVVVFTRVVVVGISFSLTSLVKGLDLESLS